MDILQGLDWLIDVGAVINFSQVTMVWGSSQELALHNHLNPPVGYIKLLHAQTLVARHMTKYTVKEWGLACG